jgi:hypothetical protein
MGYLPTSERGPKATPSVAFLRAAAVVLGVRAAWLISYDGHPTEAHAEAAAVVALAGAPSPLAQDVAAPGDAQAVRQREGAHRMIYNFLEAVGVPQLGGMDVPFWRSGHAHLPYWAAPLAELRRRVWWNYMVTSDSTEMHEDTNAAEGWIGAALKGPLKAFGIDPEQMDPDAFGDFVTTMIPPLIALAVEQRKQLDNKASERQEIQGPGLEAQPSAGKPRRAKNKATKRTPTKRTPTKRTPTTKGRK